jgi:hypothetical protein
MRKQAENLGVAALLIGVSMLAFTFISAYLFLGNDLNIVASSDLMGLFGEALAPLIATMIRVMYLGIMGWIGSTLTIRGIDLFTKIRRETPPETKPDISSEAELEDIRADKTSKSTKVATKKHTRKRSTRKV